MAHDLEMPLPPAPCEITADVRARHAERTAGAAG
jgi:hypothetical protein